MDCRVLITDAAINDLKEIVEFVRADDPAAARRLGVKLITAGLSLRRMPRRFPLHDRERNIHKMTIRLSSSFTGGMTPLVSSTSSISGTARAGSQISRSSTVKLRAASASR